jgi:MYXO-CTERM domain-containing protein
MRDLPQPKAALLTALTLATLAAPAGANGVFPAADQIVLDPSEPRRAVVRATYGMLTTRDGGATWDWICEAAVGYDDTNGWQPPIALAAGGQVLAALTDGLAVGTDGACGWTRAPALEGRWVLDVAVRLGDPSRVVAMEAGLNNVLWQSLDGGRRWVAVGSPLPKNFDSRTVDVAPSDPQRVYASGLYVDGDVLKGHIARSLDGGQSWETYVIPGSTPSREPYIAGVDPFNADVLYVRLAGAAGRLLVSSNGGVSWRPVFETTGFVRAFAISPDGAKVAVGSDIDGVWRAPSTTLAFEKVSRVAPRCFAWTESGLYACATEFVDQFTIGRSVDEGTTFDPLLHQPCIRGPLACDTGTRTGSLCPMDWPRVALLTSHRDDCNPGVDPQGSGGGAGSGGSGGAGGAGGRSTTDGGGAPGSGGGGGDTSGGGCACRAGGSDGSNGGWTGVALGLAAAAGALARRRRWGGGSRDSGLRLIARSRDDADRP